jgi:polysaccharide lyase family 4-like protein
MKQEKMFYAAGFGGVITILMLVFTVLQSESRTDKKPYQRTGNEGAIIGTISFIGDPPEPKKIDMSADPVCVKTNPHATTEDVVITNGLVANVLVYVKEGRALDEFTFATPGNPAVLEARGCRFVPHVLGLQTKQILEIRNSDQTTHNFHATPRKNPDWNQSQPAGAGPLNAKFANPEVALPFKNNQHPWMKAYAGVFDHPFFAVTNESGAFDIEGLPPGTYKLAAWHERFGEKTIDVVVTPGSGQYLHLSFDAIDRTDRQ